MFVYIYLHVYQFLFSLFSGLPLGIILLFLKVHTLEGRQWVSLVVHTLSFCLPEMSLLHPCFWIIISADWHFEVIAGWHLSALWSYFTVSDFHCCCCLIVITFIENLSFWGEGGTVFKIFSFLIFWNCTTKYVSRYELLLIYLVWDLFFLYLRIHIFHHSGKWWKHLGHYPFIYSISLILSIF